MVDKLKVSILCSNSDHPIVPYLNRWISEQPKELEVMIVNRSRELIGGEILFLISCEEKINKQIRSQFQHVLVLHASNLPKGRGWSPHIWDIIEGKSNISLLLIEAKDKIDTGQIWKKKQLIIPKYFLFDDINNVLFEAELKLMTWAVLNSKKVKPIAQDTTIVPTYRVKRTPKDSKLDINKSILDQFNLLRIADPDRYPAYIEIHGKKFKVKVEKVNE